MFVYILKCILLYKSGRVMIRTSFLKTQIAFLILYIGCNVMGHSRTCQYFPINLQINIWCLCKIHLCSYWYFSCMNADARSRNWTDQMGFERNRIGSTLFGHGDGDDTDDRIVRNSTRRTASCRWKISYTKRVFLNAISREQKLL